MSTHENFAIKFSRAEQGYLRIAEQQDSVAAAKEAKVDVEQLRQTACKVELDAYQKLKNNPNVIQILQCELSFNLDEINNPTTVAEKKVVGIRKIVIMEEGLPLQEMRGILLPDLTRIYNLIKRPLGARHFLMMT